MVSFRQHHGRPLRVALILSLFVAALGALLPVTASATTRPYLQVDPGSAWCHYDIAGNRSVFVGTPIVHTATTAYKVVQWQIRLQRYYATTPHWRAVNYSTWFWTYAN